jgi:hypothetical protein
MSDPTSNLNLMTDNAAFSPQMSDPRPNLNSVPDNAAFSPEMSDPSSNLDRMDDDVAETGMRHRLAKVAASRAGPLPWWANVPREVLFPPPPPRPPPPAWTGRQVPAGAGPTPRSGAGKARAGPRS